MFLSTLKTTLMRAVIAVIIYKLDAYIREVGFQVNHTRYFFGNLTPLVLAFRAVPYRIGLKAKTEHERNARVHKPPAGMPGKFLISRLKRERLLAKKGSWPFIDSSFFFSCKPSPSCE